MHKLVPERTGLLIIDVQEKLFHQTARSEDVKQVILKTIKGFQILHLPICVTEQYPSGLKNTLPEIRECLGGNQQFWEKTSFSCMRDKAIEHKIITHSVTQWVIVGIEAHVCILQSVKDLISLGKEVTVLNDGITSRSIFDYSTAIAEMRDCGARISSSETVLFELIVDSKHPQFKAMSALIKSSSEIERGRCGCC